jgi:hypothetical protein
MILARNGLGWASGFLLDKTGIMALEKLLL